MKSSKLKDIDVLIREKYNNSLKKKKDYSSFKKDVLRLKSGEPLEYVMGFSYFLGCRIDLSLKPLIPRQETEFWVEKAIKRIKTRKKSLICLDIFAGSGCIGIALLKHIKASRVDFSENSEKFLRQILINTKINKIKKNRFKIIQSDVFKNIAARKYDFIFANPPYIALEQKNKVQDSVLKFEPNKALFGGKEGLFYIRNFLKNVKGYLKKQGSVFMEFDSCQKKEIEKILKESGYKDFNFYKDQFGKWRYIILARWR